MKRLTHMPLGRVCGLTILIVVLLLLAPMHSASGLSTVDTVHRGVGQLLGLYPDGKLWWLACSGTLIAPQVFLTAGHCTSPAQAALDEGSLLAIYVSFDDQFTPDASLVGITGFVTHPDFSFKDWSDTDDVGVVLLATPVYDRPLTALPTEGLLDELHLAPKTPVTAVGYGWDSHDVHGSPTPLGRCPTCTSPKNRSSGTLLYRALTPAYITLTMLANQGSDNMCFGDSGGPDFVQVNGHEQLVAINERGSSASCEEVGWSYRVDTPQALAFLRQYVALP